MSYPSVFLPLVLLSVLILIRGDFVSRFHEESELRNTICRIMTGGEPNGTTAGSEQVEHDVIALENYVRNYRHGPNNDIYILFNHDLIAAYVGPAPKAHPNIKDLPGAARGVIRTWAMFDSKTKHYCDLNAVFDWGQLALFSCPHEGLYRAYAIETGLSVGGGSTSEDQFPLPTRSSKKGSEKQVLGWYSKTQREIFNIISGEHGLLSVFNLPQAGDKLTKPEDRVTAMTKWGMGYTYTYVERNADPAIDPNGQNQGNTGGSGSDQIKLDPKIMAVSDPIRIRESFYCYYWMYNIREIRSIGYHDAGIGKEIIHHVYKDEDDIKGTLTAHIYLEVSIWIAEPSAVGPKETLETSEDIVISEYSKVITRRFSKAGLFPCLRKTHNAVEVVKEIDYVSETDATSKLHETPHWRAIIIVHADRLISTLSDITFTISSRQNTASFHCFVGDTRVFYRLREFHFVKQKKMQPDDINLDVSILPSDTARNFKFGRYNIYGHGVQFIGSKWSKKYQPATNRTDVVVIANPCVAQEFALSVGGSLYIATDLLRKGTEQAQKVVLPYFPTTPRGPGRHNDPVAKEYVRIFDVAFTPTHIAFLISDSHVILHPSSVKRKGISEFSQTHKFRLDLFVKRKWCPRTVSQKLTTQMLPMFGTSGSIIILQIYPTEGSVPLWIQPASPYCLSEATGFVKKRTEKSSVIDERDIHYELYSKVDRTDHITGLKEPPVPSRPPPPPTPKRNIYEEAAYVVDSSGKFVVEGEDPHFPLELIDPASPLLEDNLKDYNQATIYHISVNENQNGKELKDILPENGLTVAYHLMAAMEFTSEEKEFVFALAFRSAEISEALGALPSQTPFQGIISTLTVKNFPYRVKLNTSSEGILNEERLDFIAPFPGGVFVRANSFTVEVAKSRDMHENTEHANELQGVIRVPFAPELSVLGTSIPSYVINLGDILVFSSVETRYARPLHFYTWDVLDEALRRGMKETPDLRPLNFDESTVNFLNGPINDTTLSDIVVTEYGLISVLRRKKHRHLVQDDELCLSTPDTEAQKVIMGSVVTLEALREIKPFFRNDNIFHRTTPDGEIIYGVYDVKPRSYLPNCPPNSTLNSTKDYNFPCVQQGDTKLWNRPIPVCTANVGSIDVPCRDPYYLKACENVTNPSHACFRKNKVCATDSTNTNNGNRYTENFQKPGPVSNYNGTQICDIDDDTVIDCAPKHAPREDLRTVHILGTSYHSYLQGSLQGIKSIHPESLAWEDDERRQEPEICPFSSFEIYYKQLDFAEVGYKTRITGEISYLGTGIPTEADLLVEFHRNIGIIVEISTSVEEDRYFSTIRKTIDIQFEMTDYMLKELLDVDPNEKHNIQKQQFDFDDVRAREPFSVFSITVRPSIVNTHCKSSDFFKTVQFNVGCNAFSQMRLVNEATPLKQINWTNFEDNSGFKWYSDEKLWNLTLPKQHIYYRQIRNGVFKCNNHTGSCQIPYYNLFQNEIYTISYRDPLRPVFEQFLTISSRIVTGNVVLYDLLGSKQFNWTINKLDAGCYNTEHFWYNRLLDATKTIGNETMVEHENIYLYYKDCFSRDESQGDRESSQNLYVSPFYFFNRTNNNTIKFLRKRNQILIFRAVAVNTYYNRFTYCKYLDTFFMVRVTGIPIPRQGLNLSLYISIFLAVLAGLIVTYIFFSKFYSGISTAL